MHIRKNVAAVAAGALIIVGLGATGAVAGQMVGSKQIKDDAVKSRHINDGAVKEKDLSKSVQSKLAATGEKGDKGDKGDAGEQGPAGPAGQVEIVTAKLDGAKLINAIGGSINANYTDLETGIELEAGTYLVTVDGSFFNKAGDLGADVYPQISVWVENNDVAGFQWQTDGDISPNALLPQVKDRHIAVSGNTVITLSKKTRVGLIAHGYTSTQGAEGSGNIEVDKALITATKIS
ncbi:collagen-like triple helix repeat-containing protein [Nocardioides daejeonensis]|uniref:collagen-like triple helix repeat-containing protein n=1 Tax=Nocardioides daejeonensis TaxID=1046556 RepID=UPI000D749ABD|nr:collagen-like protein [Nocardioides daejeonensis]